MLKEPRVAHHRPPTYYRHLPTDPNHTDTRTARIGFAFGFSAFMWWGIAMPLYLNAVKAEAIEQLLQRICFGVPSMLLLIALGKSFPALFKALRTPRVLGMLVASAFLININWFAFIYSVSNDRLMDASLGYYATPLVSIALGVVFLGERLGKLEWAGVALALSSVALATWERGSLPLLSITLMFAFAGYGLIRKRVDAGPLVGLTIEFLISLPFAFAAYCWLASNGDAAILDAPTSQLILMAFSGFMVIAPLVWFAASAKRLRLATIGILQYISPTAQMIIGLINGEPISGMRIASFGLIWIGLVFYSVGALRRSKAEMNG